MEEKDLVDQLKKVFRLKTGDKIVVFHGDGQDYECLIKELIKDNVVLEIQKTYPSRFMPSREIWLCAAIIKKDNFEWIAEKATELGVSHIVPILSERSEKKSLNPERLQKIVIEASEQSGRGNVPIIQPIIGLEESFAYLKSQASGKTFQMVAFHTEGEPLGSSALLESGHLAVFIGPEGGWSESEVELFHKENVPVKCLGRQVLRAETAAIAVLSKVVFE
ncbi:MAG: RsmE family RNA methyltransferase [Candidatus Pacebacteria bacterium]|nr:RsmE family RNA methyltransferase [Candidatus Paceibacterota bacterium]